MLWATRIFAEFFNQVVLVTAYFLFMDNVNLSSLGFDLNCIVLLPVTRLLALFGDFCQCFLETIHSN